MRPSVFAANDGNRTISKACNSISMVVLNYNFNYNKINFCEFYIVIYC